MIAKAIAIRYGYASAELDICECGSSVFGARDAAGGGLCVDFGTERAMTKPR